MNINEEMFVRYKRPSKKMKARMRHARAGGSSFKTVLVTGTTRTVNTNYENLCDGCRETEHDLQTCQSISLRRIADALQTIAENKKELA